MATKTHDPSVNMQVNWTTEGVMFVTQVPEEPSFPYLLIRDEETDLLYAKVSEEECCPELGAPRPRSRVTTSDSSDEEYLAWRVSPLVFWCESPPTRFADQAASDEECNTELGAPRPRANTSDSSDEECESPSSTRANTSDSSDEEWDEESLVHETYGRHTYNFGDTKLGPIYNNSSVFFNHDYSDDEFTEVDYP